MGLIPVRLEIYIQEGGTEITKMLAKTRFLIPVLVLLLGYNVAAQKTVSFETIEEKKDLEAIIPASFYFAGFSGMTQRRNSAAAKIGEKRFILAGLVDVSGYSSDISGIYEGFFITDSPVNVGATELEIGAYGFGFAKNGIVRFFDISGKQIIEAATIKDLVLKRPRPLLMQADEKGIHLYKGRDYVIISPR